MAWKGVLVHIEQAIPSPFVHFLNGFFKQKLGSKGCCWVPAWYSKRVRSYSKSDTDSRDRKQIFYLKKKSYSKAPTTVQYCELNYFGVS
jgi:hypothetical protein